MGRKGKERKRLARELATIPGGLEGAMARNANGQATPKDIDFLSRVTREMGGLDGYFGTPHNPTTQGHSSSTPSNGHYADNKNNSVTGGSKDKYTFTTYHSPSHDPTVFHCAEAREITDRCPLNPTVPNILMDKAMWRCFMDCCKEYSTEWIALLIGKLDKDADNKPAYLISKFYFPPQTASGAHVDVPTGVRPKPGTIGAIHSHVDMGVFWSSTDTEHSNWPVEIVINRRENYEALARYQLKCGEWAKGKATVYLTGSGLSMGVKGMVAKAFSDGAQLQAQLRAEATASVHPDDKAEVTTAIVKGTVTQGVKPQCEATLHVIGSAERMRCQEDKGHEGLCRTANNVRWYSSEAHSVNWDTPPYSRSKTGTEVLCGVEGPHGPCIREDKHAGWHRVAGPYTNGIDGYFQVDVSSASDAQGEVAQGTIAWPPKPPSLTVPIGDDPTVEDQASDEFCEKCEGYGFVEGEDGSTRPCPDCLEHPGLSKLGAVRQAEDMIH